MLVCSLAASFRCSMPQAKLKFLQRQTSSELHSKGHKHVLPQRLVWKSRTRRWKVLLQSQLVSTMHCNNCVRELPWKLFMRHPSVRSSSKIDPRKECVTSQTNNCWPWKAPWSLSPGSSNTLTGTRGLAGKPWWRSQSSASNVHAVLSAAMAMSNPWCSK